MVWLVHYNDILYIWYYCYRGTEKQAVAYDYAMRLSRGNYECQVLKITRGMCVSVDICCRFTNINVNQNLNEIDQFLILRFCCLMF